MFKKIASILLIVFMLVSMVACSNSSAQTTVITQPTQKAIRLGLVVQSLGNSFHIQLKDAATAVAKEKGIEITVLASANIEEQLKVMEDLIQTKPDAIAVTSYDAKGIIPAIEKAKAQGIPVFAVDNNVVDTPITAFIGTDNVYGGEIGFEWIAKTIGNTGKIGVILGVAGSYASNARYQGLGNKLKLSPNIKIASEVTANWKRDQGLTVATDMLTANPDLKCIFALNDEMALGAMQAIAAANRSKTVPLIGFNGVPEAVKAVYGGQLSATVVQFPETMARTYIEKAIALIKDGVKPDASYFIPAAVVDTALCKDVVDNNKKPTTTFEEVLYAKLIASVKG